MCYQTAPLVFTLSVIMSTLLIIDQKSEDSPYSTVSISISRHLVENVVICCPVWAFLNNFLRMTSQKTTNDLLLVSS